MQPQLFRKPVAPSPHTFSSFFHEQGCMRTELSPLREIIRSVMLITTIPRQSQKDCIDRKFSYTKAIIFGGLNLISFRSATRSNDGDRRVIYAKLHRQQWDTTPHWMYFAIYFFVLGRIGGFGPRHIGHDLKHNCGVNWHGGEGKNLEADLANELLNKILKGVLSTFFNN